MMKKIYIMCTVLLTAGVVSGMLYYGPYAPDYRYDENSVHAVFEVPHAVFGQPPPPPMSPLLFQTGPSSYPLAQVAPEIIDDGISAVLTLPNFIDPLPMKKMRIQMQFDTPIYGPDIWVDVTGFDPEPVTLNIVGGLEPIMDTWHYIDIEIYPNPDYEQIWVSTPFLADPIQIIEVDTISIPEPASISLIGLFTGSIYFTRRFLKA